MSTIVNRNLYRNISRAFSAEIHDQGVPASEFFEGIAESDARRSSTSIESTAALWSSKFTATGRINLDDNSARNHVEAAFAPFSQVIEDIDVSKNPTAPGEHWGGGMRAGHQESDFRSREYLARPPKPRLDRLIRAAIINSTERAKPPPELLVPSNKR